MVICNNYCTMDYLQAAVNIAREQVGAADKTSAQEATTPAAASASAAVEVVAELDMDGMPPTMKRRRKTEDQCIPAKISFQRHIDKLKKGKVSTEARDYPKSSNKIQCRKEGKI